MLHNLFVCGVILRQTALIFKCAYKKKSLKIVHTSFVDIYHTLFLYHAECGLGVMGIACTWEAPGVDLHLKLTQ